MTEPGAEGRQVLQAVAAGRVRRAPIHPGGEGPRFVLEGWPDIDAALVELAAGDLVYLPAGARPPQLTPDGEWALTNFT